MSIIKNVCFLLILESTLWGCATNNTISFINDDMDLRDYNTYRLIQVDTDDENYNMEGMVFFNQIEKTIIDNMDRRLFKTARNPDIIVRYELVSSQRTQTSTSNYYNPYTSYSPSYTTVRHYTEGILLIEFRDRRKKKLVWQGSLDLHFMKGEPDEVVHDAVNDIFETYPYQAGSYNKVISDDKK